MSEVLTDVMGGIGVSVPAETQREILANRVRADGLDLASAQAALKARGIEPLAEGTRDYLESRKEALMADPEFANAYLRGDAGTQSTLYEIDLAIQSHREGKLTDRAPPATSAQYDSLRNAVYSNNPNLKPDEVLAHADHVAGVAASMNMDATNAKTMVELSAEADRETFGMDAEAKATWQDNQFGSLRSIYGDKLDEVLKAADSVLTRVRGVSTSVAATTRESGARVGLQMIFIAQSEAGKRGW